MKIQYLCECCGDIVNEAEIATHPAGTLTGRIDGGIMGMVSGREKIVIDVFCTDCWETLYGDAGYGGVGFYGGPFLH